MNNKEGNERNVEHDSDLFRLFVCFFCICFSCFIFFQKQTAAIRICEIVVLKH